MKMEAIMKKLKKLFDSEFESDRGKKTDLPLAELDKIIKHRGVI